MVIRDTCLCMASVLLSKGPQMDRLVSAAPALETVAEEQKMLAFVDADSIRQYLAVQASSFVAASKKWQQ